MSFALSLPFPRLEKSSLQVLPSSLTFKSSLQVFPSSLTFRTSVSRLPFWSLHKNTLVMKLSVSRRIFSHNFRVFRPFFVYLSSSRYLSHRARVVVQSKLVRFLFTAALRTELCPSYQLVFWRCGKLIVSVAVMRREFEIPLQSSLISSC